MKRVIKILLLFDSIRNHRLMCKNQFDRNIIYRVCGQNFFEFKSKSWIYIQTNICITRLLNRCVQAVNESYLDFTNLRLHTDNEYIHL